MSHRGSRYGQFGRSVILLTLLTLLVVFAGVAVAEKVEPAPQVARVKVDEPLYNFGSVSQGLKVVKDFEVKNVGTGDLAIERVVPTCGCTVSAVTDKVVPPGGSTLVRVEFDTKDFTGPKYKTVRVYTNDQESPSTILSLRGVIEPNVDVAPKRVFFGKVVRAATDGSTRKKVTVKVREGSDIKIKRVHTYSKKVELENISLAPKEASFEIALVDDAPLGELRDRVVVQLSGGRRSSINVPIFASVQGNLRLKPSTLAFGILEKGRLTRRSVKLVNRGPKDVQLLGVKSNHKAVSAVTRVVKEGRIYVVEVSVAPDKVTSDLRALVEIATDDEDQKTVALSVYGILPPAAQG